MKNTELKRIIKILIRLYALTKREFFSWGIIRLVGGIASATCGLLFNWYLGQILDLSLSNDKSKLVEFAIAFLLTAIIFSLVCWSNRVSGSKYNSYSGEKLRELSIKKITKLPIAFFEKKHSAKIASKIINNIDSLKEFYGNSVAGIWSYVPATFIIGILMLTKINVKLTIICFIVIPLFTYIVSKLAVPINKHSKETHTSTETFLSLLRDFLDGTHLYKIYNMEISHGDKIVKASKEILKSKNKIHKRNSLINSIGAIASFVPQIMAYGIGSIYVANGEITIGELYIFTTVLFPFIETIKMLSNSWTDIVEKAGQAEQLFDFFDEDEENTKPGKKQVKSSEYEIVFENVFFSYANKGTVLKDISFKIPKNSVTALVGESGCGKTTVQKLICGYYLNYDGIIKVNGNEIKDLNLNALRKEISVVSQNNFIFNDTIFQNIKFGNIHANDYEVFEVAKKAYIHEYILSLPEGYNTIVGERGTKLSGGQIQRLSIARAFLMKSKILLFDEPTSSLDSESSKYIEKSIIELSKNKTVIIIAHTLSTIEQADIILVLEKGKIIEKGNHKELLDNKSKYEKLFNEQLVNSMEEC